MMHYIVSSLSNAIFFFDLEGHCVYANQSALEIAGAADELQVEEKVPALRGLLGFTGEDLLHEFERDVETEKGRFYHVEYYVQIAKPNGPFCGAERPQCGASGQPFPT